jgi:PKD repeat protein
MRVDLRIDGRETALHRPVMRAASALERSLDVRTKGERHRIATLAATAAMLFLLVAGTASAAPPVASFSVSAGEHYVGTPVTFTSTSTDPDGDALDTRCDFVGDGGTDLTGASVSRTFTAPGTVTVTLTVVDSAGESASRSQQLGIVAAPPPPVPEPAPAPPPSPKNVKPVAAFTFQPAVPAVGQPITFTATASDTDGLIAVERWDLNGDGKFSDASGTVATWAFSQPGAHTVRLRVRDNGGAAATATLSVVVDQPPVAAFTTAPAVVVAGDTVTFVSTSSDADGHVASLAWDLDGDSQFNDGDETTVAREFATPGVVVVRLRATDNRGVSSVTSGTVTVLKDLPPLASFTFTPAAPVIGAPVLFRSTSTDPDGSIAALAWDLDGDGFFNNATGVSAARAFPLAGDVTTALRATDDRGATSIAFQTVTVHPLPPAVAPIPPRRGTPAIPAPAFMTPFPVVRIRGQVVHGLVRIQVLGVRAQRGARILGRCRGPGCSRIRTVVRASSFARVTRLRRLERTYRPGARIEIFITMPNRIGKYVRFELRGSSAPTRRDMCVRPGTTRPVRCPER